MKKNKLLGSSFSYYIQRQDFTKTMKGWYREKSRIPQNSTYRYRDELPGFAQRQHSIKQCQHRNQVPKLSSTAGFLLDHSAHYWKKLFCVISALLVAPIFSKCRTVGMQKVYTGEIDELTKNISWAQCKVTPSEHIRNYGTETGNVAQFLGLPPNATSMWT